MGDLILKLPTDNVVMPADERENFLMLFPDENQSHRQQVGDHQQQQQHHDVGIPPQQQPHPVLETTKRQEMTNTQKLKKEVMSLMLFIVVFFILNLPYVKNLIVEYIPMCHKSWIATHLVQSILFAFILWIVINSEYSRV